MSFTGEKSVAGAEVDEGGHVHESERDELISNAPATATVKATATATSVKDNDGQQQQNYKDLFHDAVQTHTPDTNINITTTSSDDDRPDADSDSTQWAAIVKIHKELRQSTGSATTTASTTMNDTSVGGEAVVATEAVAAEAACPSRMIKGKASQSRSRRKEMKDGDGVDATPFLGTGSPGLRPNKQKATKIKTKAKTKTKDPHQPKRPAAAFFLFLKAESGAVQSGYPNLSRSEIVSVMSDAWRTASPEDKQPYVEQNQAALKLWREQVQLYKSYNSSSRQRSTASSTSTATTELHGASVELLTNDNHSGGDDDDDDDNDEGDVDVFTNPGSESAVSSATTAAAATALLRIAGTEQQQQQQRVKDGCMAAKIKPMQRDDGSFFRPRGAAPKGFSWGASTGMWVPVQILALPNSKPKPKQKPTSEPSTTTTNKKQSKSASSTAVVAQETAATKTQLPKPKTQLQKPKATATAKTGCMEAKLKPMQREDGTFFRPRGASPKGFSWGASTGLWVPLQILALPNNKPKPKQKPTSEPSTTNNNNNNNKQIKSASSKAVLSQKTAATKTQLQKPKAAATAKTGCMEAKVKPLPKDDGTFFRPRGASPKGFSWDATAGLWAPALSKPTNKTPSSKSKNNNTIQTKNASSSTGTTVLSQKSAAANPLQKPKATAATNTQRLKKNGCMEPKSKPKKRWDGSFAHPRGVPPAGLTWNDKNGLWVPQSWEGGTASTDSTRPISNESVAQTASALEGRGDSDAKTTVSENSSSSLPPTRTLSLVDEAKKTQAQTSMTMPASKYKFPKAKLTKDQDGSYRRPRGSVPIGHDWDSALGVWVRRDEGTAAEQGSSSNARKRIVTNGFRQRKEGTSWPSFQTGGLGSLDDVPLSDLARVADATATQLHRAKTKTSNAVPPRRMAPRSPTKEMGHEPKYILKKPTLQKKGDGTYLRPRGRAPAGCSWEAESGAWVTTNATSKAASKDPARSSHASSDEEGVLATDTITSPAGSDSMSQGQLNGPLHALAPKIRLLLAREGVTTAEQFMSRGTSELAEAYIQWRARENLPELKGKTSAGTRVSAWKSVVRRASAELGIDIRHPPTKRGRPKESTRNRAESHDDAPMGTQRRPLQESESQSRQKRRRVERPSRSSKPTYVSCGACKGCLTTQHCGTCLPCRQRIDTLAGCSEPLCVNCICIAPVVRPTTTNKADIVSSPLPMASTTDGARSGDMPSRRSAVRTTADSVVESLSDHDSLVMDDMSNLESPAAAASLSRGRSVKTSSAKRSHSKALSGADLARQLQQADRFRIQFDDSDDDESHFSI